MLNTLAIAGYRSLRSITLPLGRLNIITGANGSGKSNLYRALRLLAETAQGNVVGALAREGGLQATLWAGPEHISPRMERGEVPIQGGPRRERPALKLGFSGDDFGYAIDFGFPTPSSQSAFSLDPEIKCEAIWSGECLRLQNTLVERCDTRVRTRDGRGWRVMAEHLSAFESIFTHVADPERAPEVMTLRESIRGWRFYDHFRSDADAPARLAQWGTRTPVLSHDGRDLAAAWQTICEIGDHQSLNDAVNDAFPGAQVEVVASDNRFGLQFQQHGLLRALSTAELSDGTLRYLLWIAALHTPRPPSLMVLNEPETSLHPDLLPALARLIVKASTHSQIWVVSHAPRLIADLESAARCNAIRLEKNLSQTKVAGLRTLDEPPWHWPER
jgi:predicted ATPase